MSPQFKVKVEIVPNIGMNDPESLNKQREISNSRLQCTEGISNVKAYRLISFTIDCASREEADKQTSDMCDALLVNPVLAASQISIEEI